MALSPDLRNRVGLAPATGAKLVAPADTGADALGGSVAKFGATLGVVADQEDAIDEMYDIAGVRDVSAEATASLVTSERVLLDAKGKNAVSAYADYADSAAAIRKDARSRLTNDRQLALFDAQWQEQENASNARAAKHRDEQVRVYALDSNEARISASTDAAINATLAGDEHSGVMYRATVVSEYRARGELEGWSAEETRDKTSAHLSKLEVKVVEGMDGDPLAQVDYLDKRSHVIRPEDEIGIRARLAPQIEAARAKEWVDPAMDEYLAGLSLPEGAPGSSANTELPEGDEAKSGGEYQGDGEAPAASKGSGQQYVLKSPPKVRDTSMSVGEQNNNPGNMLVTSWTKKQPGFIGAGVGSSGGTAFGAFDTWENGVKAHDALVRNKWEQGGKTLDGITRFYIRADGRATSEATQYANNLAKKLGISPTAPIPESMIPAVAGQMRVVETGNKAAASATDPRKGKSVSASGARVTKFTENKDYAARSANPMRGVGRTGQKGQEFGAVRVRQGKKGTHIGKDYGGDVGTPFFAPRPGKVAKVQTAPAGGTGRIIWVDHGNGLVTKYFHMASVNIKQGDWVDENTKLGGVGGSGHGSEKHYKPHLHYEIWYNGKPQDPDKFDWSPHDAKGYTAGDGSASTTSAPQRTTYTPAGSKPRASEEEARRIARETAAYQEATPRQREVMENRAVQKARDYNHQLDLEEREADRALMDTVLKIEAEGGTIVDPVSQLGDVFLKASPSAQRGLLAQVKAEEDRNAAEAERQAQLQAQIDAANEEAASKEEKQVAAYNARTVLNEMAASDDPKTRAAFLEVNMSQYVGVLPDSEIKYYQKLQAERRQAGTAGNPLIVTTSQASTYLGFAFTRPKTYTDREWGVLASELALDLTALQERKGAPLTDQEKVQAARNFVSKKHYVWSDGGWLSGPGFDFDNPITSARKIDTPEQERTVPVDWYNAYKRNNPGASQLEVLQAWEDHNNKRRGRK